MQVENIFSLIEKSDDSTQLLKCLETINSSLLIEDFTPYEKELYSLLVSNLENNNKDVQIAALDTLNNCIKRDLFIGTDYKDISLIVVNIVKLFETDNVEHQEIFIKATTCLQEMKQFHNLLYQTKSTDMIDILKKIINSSISVVNKIHALKMLEDFAKNTFSLNELEFLTIWMEDICPLMFNMNQNNLLNSVLEYSNNMLPMHLRLFQQHTELYNSFATTAENTYIPIIAKLVSRCQTVFSQLWIYLCRLLSIKFHIGFQLVNMMLAVVETAFKSQNVDIRHSAFSCWQVLINEFLNNPDLNFTDKRVKLLCLPLKANNGRTEKIAQIKFETWCKLLSALFKRNINVTNFNIIDNFLQFCFGPLQETLLSWVSHGTNVINSGKRYPTMYLNKCKAFLQLFGLKKYIDQSLMLNHFEFSGPILDLNIKQTKYLINAVGECSLLLSILEKDDNNERNLIITAVWKSLFGLIDHLENEEHKQNCIQQTCTLITTMSCIARRKPEIINHCLLPVFSIVTSADFEFFKQNKINDILILPFVQIIMKKDKALLQKDIVVILKKIFTFKQQHDEFLKFVQLVLNRFALGIKESLSEDKIDILRNIWLCLVEDLKVYLHNITITDEDFVCSFFCEFLLWPVLVLNQNFSHEVLAIKWKELYFVVGVAASLKLRNNLAIQMLKFCQNKPECLSGVARIICYVLYQFNTIYNSSDLGPEIVEIFNVIKHYVFLDNLNNEVVDILQLAFQKLISSSSVHPYFLEDYIMENILHLIIHYNRLKLLEEVHIISKFYTNKTQYFNKFNILLDFVTQNKVGEHLVEKIRNNLHKRTDTIIFGHNVDTMKPVPVKGSNLPNTKSKDELVFINTPYKFDSHKLTPNQKEKFSQRKIDIPALYEDLTQSTQEFSNSSLDKLETQKKVPKKRGRKPSLVARTDPDYPEKVSKKTRNRNSTGSPNTEQSTDIVKSVKTRRMSLPKRDDLHTFISESDDSCSQSSQQTPENVKPVKNRRLSAIKRDENYTSGSEIDNMEPEMVKPLKTRRVSAVKRAEFNKSGSEMENSEPETLKTGKIKMFKSRRVSVGKREEINKSSPEINNTSTDTPKMAKNKKVSPEKREEMNKTSPESVFLNPEPSKLVKNRRLSSTKRETTSENTVSDSEILKLAKNRKISTKKLEETAITSPEINNTSTDTPKMAKTRTVSPGKREEINKTSPEPLLSDPAPSKLIKNRRLSSTKRETTSEDTVSDSEILKLTKNHKISTKKLEETTKTLPEINNRNTDTLKMVKNRKVSPGKHEEINKTSVEPVLSDPAPSKLVKNRRLSSTKRETTSEDTVSDSEILKLTKNHKISTKKLEETTKTSPEINNTNTDTLKMVKNRKVTPGKHEEINKTSVEPVLSDPAPSKLVKIRRLSSTKRETTSEDTVSDSEILTLTKNRKISPEIPVSDSETLKYPKTSTSKPEEINKTSPEIKQSELESSTTQKPDNLQDQVFKLPPIIPRGKQQDVEKIMEDNLSDYENLDEKIKYRVSRELLRIQMDIKNTEDFYKHGERKTRMSGNLSLEESSDDDKLDKPEKRTRRSTEERRKRRSQNSDVIEATQEVPVRRVGRPKQDTPKPGKILKQIKLPVLYPLDSVKPGERVYISSGPTSTDLIKGPDPSSPFRILPNESIPEKSPACKEILFASPEPVQSPSSPKIIILSNEVIVEAQKTNSETATLDLDTPESQENNFSSRIVLFSEPETIENAEAAEENLPGSPVNVDTPTRNKELLKNTLEISPIKVDELEKPSSPETTIPERVGNNSPHPQRVFFRKKGRGAQMMNLVSVKPPSPKKKAEEPKADSSKPDKPELIIPPQNRTMKMMENIGQLPENANNAEEIKEEDILTFQRELPSPMASPGPCILKKRKCEDNLEAIMIKRRRVNFHDPPVSSRKYIEMSAKNRSTNSILKEERMTRSKSEEIDVEINIHDLQEPLSPPAENVEEITEKFNEVSVIKNSESLFSEILPEAEAEAKEVNVVDERAAEASLEDNVERIINMASEKPEIQSFLVEKLLSVCRLENIFEAVLNEYSFDTAIVTIAECHKNRKNKYF